MTTLSPKDRSSENLQTTPGRIKLDLIAIKGTGLHPFLATFGPKIKDLLEKSRHVHMRDRPFFKTNICGIYALITLNAYKIPHNRGSSNFNAKLYINFNRFFNIYNRCSFIFFIASETYL